MECSAKDNYNITELFKTLLALSKIIPPEHPIETNGGGPLKRRSSAYVSATSKGEWQFVAAQNIRKQCQLYAGRNRVPSPSLGHEKSTSSFFSSNSNGSEASGSDGKSKPRSRWDQRKKTSTNINPHHRQPHGFDFLSVVLCWNWKATKRWKTKIVCSNCSCQRMSGRSNSSIKTWRSILSFSIKTFVPFQRDAWINSKNRQNFRNNLPPKSFPFAYFHPFLAPRLFWIRLIT